MKLLWHPLPVLSPPVTGMICWDAEYGRYRYILSYDPQHQHWIATAKYRGNFGKHIDLGGKHATRAAAVAACEEHATS